MVILAATGKGACADLATAMIAFFPLFWLLSSTTGEQKAGIGDYFTPTASIRHSESGEGGILGGQTLSDPGTKIGEGGTSSVAVELTPLGKERNRKIRRGIGLEARTMIVRRYDRSVEQGDHRFLGAFRPARQHPSRHDVRRHSYSDC